MVQVAFTDRKAMWAWRCAHKKFISTLDMVYGKVFGIKGKMMSVPSKIHTIQLVKIQPGARLATTTELNHMPSLVTGCSVVIP